MLFGKYTGVKKGIEWIYVKEIDGCDLYITKDVILCGNWDDTNSAIRAFAKTLTGKLLNDTFYTEAFSEQEKEKIIEYFKVGCKVFVPTLAEIDCLTEKKAKILPSLKKKVNYVGEDGCTLWFLRDKSSFCDTNWTCIDDEGNFDSVGGDFVCGGTIGIRPCILLKKE